jgi:hypothetical protein
MLSIPSNFLPDCCLEERRRVPGWDYFQPSLKEGKGSVLPGVQILCDYGENSVQENLGTEQRQILCIVFKQINFAKTMTCVTRSKRQQRWPDSDYRGRQAVITSVHFTVRQQFLWDSMRCAHE